MGLLELKYWSRDLVIILPKNGLEGLQSWTKNLPCYKNPIGLIQAAICLEIDGTYCDTGFDNFSLALEGADGLLPNLDLVNIMVRLGESRYINISTGASELNTRIPNILNLRPYASKLLSIISMLWRQGSGYPRNIHIPFLKSRIETVTLRAMESKRRENDDFHSYKFRMFYEIIEGTLRSMNNALEHLHQSFFFYLMPDGKHFISIANYLPLSGLLSASTLLKVNPCSLFKCAHTDYLGTVSALQLSGRRLQPRNWLCNWDYFA